MCSPKLEYTKPSNDNYVGTCECCGEVVICNRCTPMSHRLDRYLRKKASEKQRAKEFIP